MTVHVREANERDTADIVALWEDFMELLRCTNPHYWKVRDGRAAFSTYLVNALTEDNILVAVAEIKGEGLVGFFLAQIEILPEWFGSEQIGIIRYQCVSENYRGKGVGHEMTTFAIEWFRSLGIRRIELNVLNGLPASGYWSKIGFKEFMDRRFIEI